MCGSELQPECRKDAWQRKLLSGVLVVCGVLLGVYLAMVKSEYRIADMEDDEESDVSAQDDSFVRDDSDQEGGLVEDIYVDVAASDWSAALKKARLIKDSTLRESLIGEIKSRQRIELKIKKKLRIEETLKEVGSLNELH